MMKIIVVNYNTKKYLEKFVDSLYLHTSMPEFMLAIVDNGSTEPASIEYLRQIKKPNLLIMSLSENVGYGQAIDKAYRQFVTNKDECFVIANSDIEIVHPGWIETMVNTMRQSNAGSGGPKIIMPSCRLGGAGFVGTRQNHRIQGNNVIDRQQFDKREDVLFVSGCFMVVNRAAYEQVGGFDPVFKMYFEETDLQYRMAEVGYMAVYEPAVTVLHHFNRSPNLAKRRMYLDSLKVFTDRYDCDKDWVKNQLLTQKEIEEWVWK